MAPPSAPVPVAHGLQGPVGPRAVIAGRERDYFAGCSYLGLQNHPELIAAAAAALQRYGLGAGTSRGGYGEHPIYTAVEEAAARYFGSEAALYFASGYLGGMILLQGLRGEFDRIFVDEAAHFSAWDAVRSAGVPAARFHHADPSDLAALLKAGLRPGERPLVITDGVFPVSGEIAPLPDYARVLREYEGAILLLDDAHATGVLGIRGQGTVEYWCEFDPHGDAGLAGVRVLSTHTLSKALGCGGGIIPAGATLDARLRRDAPAWVAHSPAALPVAAAGARALELAGGRSSLRRRLWANVARARRGFRSLGWPLAQVPVPILCLGSRPGIDLAQVQAGLFNRDICVAHVTRYSSTPAGGALRIAIFATHAEEQIDRLIAETGRLI